MCGQIFLECGSSRDGELWFEFSKSKTGQLDFVGKVSPRSIGSGEASEQTYQKIDSSTYFSPSHYIYIDDRLNVTPHIYISEDTDISDKNTFDYLTHAGALLSALEAKDSLLAGELYLRRRRTFDKFPALTQYMMRDLSAEILFSLCFGRMEKTSPEDISPVFNTAQQKLHFDESRETLEQAFIRYFKDNRAVLTLPVVGTYFHSWEREPELLNNLCSQLNPENLLGQIDKIRRAKHDFYASLQLFVQAEPFNSHDKNAIQVCIENTESKLSGNVGLMRAGYVRALAAKVLRSALPQKMRFEAKLMRISEHHLVVQVEI